MYTYFSDLNAVVAKEWPTGMSSPLLTWVALTAFAPFLGALIPLISFARKGKNEADFLTSLLLALSAGALFCNATLALIPEAIELVGAAVQTHAHSHGVAAPAQNTSTAAVQMQHDSAATAAVASHSSLFHSIPFALTGVGIGFFFFMLLEVVLETWGSSLGHGHSHSGSSSTTKRNKESKGVQKFAAIVAFLLHSIVDGVIVSGAFEASSEVGASVALAMVWYDIVYSYSSRLLHFLPLCSVLSFSLCASHAMRVASTSLFPSVQSLLPLGLLLT